MRYFIGGILVLIALIILGLIWRKKVYDEVDRLEGWKMDIMNRNVTEELSRVKALNLSGQTQERFETWRSRWDQILTRELPDLEEDLFDAEEAADRYRMKRVKKVLNNTEKKLQDIEQDIEEMFNELEVLLDSEKSSRLEIEALAPDLKDLKKKLIHNRHQYGKAVRLFESRVEELEGDLNKYEEKVEQGNYLEANDLVQSVRDKLVLLSEEVASFPELLKKTQTELPEQLSELLAGMQDMGEEGYRVSHLGFIPEVEDYQEQLNKSVEALEKGDQEGIHSLIEEIDTRIQEIYQTLEQEALANTFVEKQRPTFQASLEELDTLLQETNQELDDLQVTYQMESEDLETHRTIDQSMTLLKKKYLNFEKKREDGKTSFSELRVELEDFKEQLDELNAKHKSFSERVQTLRKDELEAKNKLAEMEQLILDTHRRLKRSNLPGIPVYFFEEMQKAGEDIDHVFQSLELQPLDMAQVNDKLEVAIEHTQAVNQDAGILIKKAHLVERLIQYGNRYRSKYPLLAAELLEAENDFRSYRYEEALEKASSAIKEVDPDAFSRIEEGEQVPV
ncbi:septation ring formation regulator EzrA [Halobacillus shinanisalinarum]|uniref:Septation ring formation regulator EzrA n=1 Tax=Halobacillus shinanisalinarum TaxID=2932258 RepID=A0ABY4H1U0_9BACI|nr:septation ring formation regulator EzrA [Halobacillus shinanisalinarum]UOQ94143.1 septation ring formation regulator EzrA [Halobacillus shinanisalinarum]